MLPVNFDFHTFATVATRGTGLRMLKIDGRLLCRMESDLGLNTHFIKGQNKEIRNCWHFYTDGKAIDVIFQDDGDFIAGMNRMFVVLKNYEVTILAFVLMDTHVHFILYGDFTECNRFVHEYVRRTSMFINHRYSETKKLGGVPIRHQPITDDRYLKSAIC